MDPEIQSRVNESPHPARLSLGLHHETHQPLSGVHHPRAQNGRAADAQGMTVVDVCRVIEVMQPTYLWWRQQYGGMQAEEARRLTQLEKENARLKKLLAEAELEKAMLKDLAEGNF